MVYAKVIRRFKGNIVFVFQAGAGTPVNSADWDGPRQRKNIFINLSKLQAGTLQVCQRKDKFCKI